MFLPDQPELIDTHLNRAAYIFFCASQSLVAQKIKSVVSNFVL